MTYSELLLSHEWKTRRKEIVNRDKLVCRNCKNKNITKNFGKALSLLVSDALGDNLRYCFAVDNKIKSVFLKTANINWPNDIASKYVIIYLDQKDKDNIRPIAVRLCLEIEKTIFNIIDPLIAPKQTIDDAIWVFNNVLHVHHEYYKVGLLPWDYDDDALITLCWECHRALHENSTVPVFDKEGKLIQTYTPCNRCFGAGWFPEFLHVEKGICFECRGAKYYELL